LELICNQIKTGCKHFSAVSTIFLEFIFMTAQTVTGFDLLHDLSTDGDNYTGLPNFSYALYNYTTIDPSITSAVGKYTNENWVAKTKGSDIYDPESKIIQTINLKSNEGSKLTYTTQSDPNNHIDLRGVTLTTSDKKITLSGIDSEIYSQTKSADSLTGTGGGSWKRIFSYSNLGESGTFDDINAKINRNDTWTDTLKNGLWIQDIKGTYTFNYTAGSYKVDISATITTKESYSDPDVNSSDYTELRHELTTISKYSFFNANTGFNITLAGMTDSNFNSAENALNSEKTLLTKVNLTTSDFKLTVAKVTYDAIYDEESMSFHSITNLHEHGVVSVDAMQDDLMKYVIPNLMNGDNNITITNKEGVQIDAGLGKDTVIGSIGNDTIIGGAGSDKLTGGKGADTFSFSNADFYTENANGNSVFNKSADTITDFNLKEHDILDFGDLGELSFYTTLNAAKVDDAHLFYLKGSGKIYLNVIDTNSGKYVPTVIITLTGKPAVNADLTDWDYPA
jgi:Ca2+-binding RTX toxin-like protein